MLPSSVAVIGLGYIGLPTAAILANSGLDVTGVDIDPKTVEVINRGHVPFVEQGLDVAVQRAVSSGRLRAQAEMPHAEAYIIAVPTPLGEGYTADLSAVEAAADAIASTLTGGELIVLESTSPPGTTQAIAARMHNARPDLAAGGASNRPALQFAHCPERVLPGRIMEEIVRNDRVVGGLTGEASARTAELYAVFCRGDILTTSAGTAEMVKLAENSYRDVNIAFANELSMIGEAVGVDVWEVISLANRHPRVDILRPGPGVGGHCIAIDPWFLVSAAPDVARLVRQARETNVEKTRHVIEQIVAAAGGAHRSGVSILGLAFKADVGDLRESPAIEVAQRIAAKLSDQPILVCDPNIDRLPSELATFANIELVDTTAAVSGSGTVALLVDHQEFLSLESSIPADAVTIDTRGIWTPDRPSRLRSEDRAVGKEPAAQRPEAWRTS
ncbi:UDP-N-acetyl-D-mannosamine dehydrogenase [Cellulomonas hominis]